MAADTWMDQTVLLEPVLQGNGRPVAAKAAPAAPVTGGFLTGSIDADIQEGPKTIGLKNLRSNITYPAVKPTGRRFSFADQELPPGSYVLSFRRNSQDDRDTQVAVEIRARETTYVSLARNVFSGAPDFRALFGGLEVVVVDRLQRPIEGARITVLPTWQEDERGRFFDDDDDQEECDPQGTDAKGSCTVRSLAAGKYAVYAEAPGYQQSALRMIDVEGQHLARVKLEVSALLQHSSAQVARVHGKVLTPTGGAAYGARVRLASPEQERCTSTDENGGFVFQWVPVAAPYSLSVSGGGVRTENGGRLTLAAGENTLPPFKLQSGEGTPVSCSARRR